MIAFLELQSTWKSMHVNHNVCLYIFPGIMSLSGVLPNLGSPPAHPSCPIDKMGSVDHYEGCDFCSS